MRQCGSGSQAIQPPLRVPEMPTAIPVHVANLACDWFCPVQQRLQHAYYTQSSKCHQVVEHVVIIVVETVVIINLGIHLTKYTEYRWWLIFINYLGRVLQCFPHVYLNSLHNSKKKVLLLVLFCRQRSSNWKGTDIGLLASQLSGDIQTHNKGFGDPASHCPPQHTPHQEASSGIG